MNKRYVSLSIALIAGLGLGMIAVQELRAQSKGPAYVIAELEISNMKGYREEFVPLLQTTLKNHGGRFIAAAKPEPMIGDAPKTLAAIIAFDSMEKAKGWFTSEEYQAAGKVRDKYAKLISYAVQGNGN